jgi:hypothetical protein
MSTTPAKSDYLLLFRSTDLEKRLAPEELNEAMRRLNDWIERWTERGNFKTGQPLGPEGRVITGGKQRLVADGPFAESKEVVGGFVVVEADGIEEATRIGEDWPLLDYGAVLEVRPLIPRCPHLAVVQDELAAAGA